MKNINKYSNILNSCTANNTCLLARAPDKIGINSARGSALSDANKTSYLKYKLSSHTKIILYVPMLLFLSLSFTGISYAQEEVIPTPKKTALKKLDAYRSVLEGNQLLLNGDPAKALDYYQRAQELKPDAREIDFVKGLGHYALQEFEESRQAFQRAAAGKNDALANDAFYSLGTTYHAEALASKDDPQLAISHLESAMRQYQNVLANHPEHEAARDANYKAATYWRNIKKILEQQQQQQNQNSNEDQDKEENEDQKEQNKDQQQDQNQDQQENQQQSDSENQDQQQDQQSDNAQQDEQQQDSKEAQAQQQEQVSKEQAERKLREMMQALRERKKAQREKKRLIPIPPVDKDW